MSTLLNETMCPLPKVRLVETDGEPLESAWHRAEINLLIDSIENHYRGRTDFYAGGNMFIYFSEEQARNRDFRGPDFFFVRGVSHEPVRPYWVVWPEGGRYPDVIIELLSANTAELDRTVKKKVYEKTFNTYEYFLYDPETQQLEGFRIKDHEYEPISPNEKGWLRCKELGLWLGTWQGNYLENSGTWLRFLDDFGLPVPIRAEVEKENADLERQRADAERQRADVERRRADAAEAEITRLKALLVQKANGES